MPSTGQRVVVITGASSGVGRCTALAFAKRQDRLVLASRNESALAEVAELCRTHGAEAMIRPTDVADESEVEALRAAAVDAFGRIDVWVNCAAVLLLGRFEELPPDAFRRVIETNVLGYANGARAALVQFQAQGNQGTLINVGSVLGLAAEPYASAYVTTKFAIRGLTACLRQEMRVFPNIHVCAVLPAALDTPIYQRAGNYIGQAARSIVPVYDPAKAARAIVRLAERPRRSVVIGSFGHFAALLAQIAPGFVERVAARLLPPLQFNSEHAVPSAGSLFETDAQHALSGGWREYWKKRLLFVAHASSAEKTDSSRASKPQ